VWHDMRALLAPLVLCAAPSLEAQLSFRIDGHPVQVHGFASQGFAYSGQNNYLTMNTSHGSFALTDVGVNASFQLTDRFHVGAQVYTRNIGHLGDWHPQLDWAVADYRFTDWFGIRGGVVKTVFGLEGDTQDMEFIHTFALLPQSVYPTDLRDALLRHRGGDLYGEIPLKHLGSLSYTAYAGQREDSRYGGYPYLLLTNGGHIASYGGLQVGADLRWNSPWQGLLIGASRMSADVTGTGTWTIPTDPPATIPYEEHSKRDWMHQFYGQYTAGNLRLASEYRRYWRDQAIFSDTYEVRTDVRGWYASAAYRFTKHLELGAYYSRWMVTPTDAFHLLPSSQDAPDRHLYDKVITARFDLNHYWNVKVEGHFMDGNGGVWSYPSGFYAQDNAQGLQPKTNLLLIRTGWSF
jgi:hypothetical protein